MNYVETFKRFFDVARLKRMYDAGETEILCGWIEFTEMMGGVENAHDAMEDIEYELDIYLEVSDYNDVVINWHGY